MAQPGPELGTTTWDDYLEQGAMKAIEVAHAISGADKVNAVGWCVGGTILSSALAVMRARGDKSVASLTLLTTMLDFCGPGRPGRVHRRAGRSQREQGSAPAASIRRDSASCSRRCARTT